MAYYTIKFFSNSLRRNVTFDMVIPNDEREDLPVAQNAHTRRPMKTILLLHGYTGDASPLGLEEEAVKYNFAMVMPKRLLPGRGSYRTEICFLCRHRADRLCEENLWPCHDPGGNLCDRIFHGRVWGAPYGPVLPGAVW